MNIDSIIAYENGELDAIETIALFADGIASGFVWKLQGHYGRTATSLIERGLISPAGKMNVELIDEVLA